jgi:hypothetical protein
MAAADERPVLTDPPTGWISNTCNQGMCTPNRSQRHHNFMVQRINYHNLMLILTQTIPEADTNHCGRRRFRSTCPPVMHNAIKRQWLTGVQPRHAPTAFSASHSTVNQPSVVDEWSTLMFRITGVSISNLGHQTELSSWADISFSRRTLLHEAI